MTDTNTVEKYSEPTSMVRRPIRQNAHKYWSSTENDMLVKHFNERKHPTDIANIHGRTIAAIISQLSKLGLVVVRGKCYFRVETTPWISFGEIKNDLHG